MTGLAVDGRDRLWILATVPAATWRQVPRGGPEGAVPRTMLTGRGGTVLVSKVEYETPTWPRAVLYEVEVKDGASGASAR